MGKKSKKKDGMPSKRSDASKEVSTEPNQLDEYQRRNRRIIIYVAILLVVATGVGGYKVFDLSRKSRYRDECEAAKTRGEWAKLELTAREWILWEPENQKPWLYAALAAESVGDELRQMEYLNGAPGEVGFDVQLLRSDLQFRNDKVYEAAESFKKLIEEEPKSKEAHRRLAFYYAMTLQHDPLIDECRRAIETGADVPQTYVYLVGADWLSFTNGYQVNLQWATQYPGNSEIFEVASALHLVASGVDQSMEQKDEKLRAALSKKGELIQKLRVKYPENSELAILELRYNVIEADARRVGEVLNSLDSELENDSRVWRVIGWFYSYKEEWEEAEDAYKKCLEMNPFDWQARFEYANVLRNLKKTDLLKPMQESAALGKDIMRNVLQADNTVEIPKSTLQQIVAYAKACGETEVSQSLQARLNGNEK